MPGIVSQLRMRNAPSEQIRLISSLGSWPLSQTARDILTIRHGSSDQSRHLVPPRESAAIGRAFHAVAGTLTPGVRRSLDSMRAGKQWLRVAHQPNFAAYLKVVGMFIAAEEAAVLTGTVPAYIMNDCDVVTNKRFSRVILPDAAHPRGGRYLNVRDSGIPSSLVTFRAGRLPAAWLRRIVDLVHQPRPRPLRQRGIRAPDSYRWSRPGG